MAYAQEDAGKAVADESAQSVPISVKGDGTKDASQPAADDEDEQEKKSGGWSFPNSRQGMLEELEKQREQQMALSTRLSAYSNKGVLAHDELEQIRNEFKGRTPIVAGLKDEVGIPKGADYGIELIDGHEEVVKRDKAIIEKHFPGATFLVKQNVKDQNVLVILGVDLETANAVINMEDAKETSDRRVKELDVQMTQEMGGKESGRLEAGLIDSETLTK